MSDVQPTVGQVPAGPDLLQRTRVINVVFTFDLDVYDRINSGGGFPSVVKAGDAPVSAPIPPPQTITIDPLPDHADQATINKRVADLAVVAMSLGYASSLVATALSMPVT